MLARIFENRVLDEDLENTHLY